MPQPVNIKLVQVLLAKIQLESPPEVADVPFEFISVKGCD